MSLRRADNVSVFFTPKRLTKHGMLQMRLGRRVYDVNQLHRDDAVRMQHEQMRAPVFIGRVGERRYWQFQNTFDWENERLTARQVHALLAERQSRRHAQLDRAEQLLVSDRRAAGQPPRRQHISDEVKHFVWMRDQGRCRHCGESRELQYDHIIPISKGGSSAPENLQILCGPCNRRKSSSVRLPARG